MEELFKLIGLEGIETMLRNRFIYASFCLLIFSILLYFWFLSKNKAAAKAHNSNGLVYLSLTYLLYFAIGLASVYEAPLNAMYVLSGLISMCYLLSLPFFSLGFRQIDRLVEHPSWETGVKIGGFVWLVMVSWINAPALIETIDQIICVTAFTLLGFFITRYFIDRKMYPIAFVAFMVHLTVIALQLSPPDMMVTVGKFGDLNTVVLGPGLVLSVTMLSYTFSWINELNFHELSNIWLSSDDPTNPAAQQVSRKVNAEKDHQWMEKLAKDELELVIEEVIIMKKHQNKSLEDILNIASRNTRNNNNRLKDLIDYDEYQLNRNRLSQALMAVIK